MFVQYFMCKCVDIAQCLWYNIVTRKERNTNAKQKERYTT